MNFHSSSMNGALSCINTTTRNRTFDVLCSILTQSENFPSNLYFKIEEACYTVQNKKETKWWYAITMKYHQRTTASMRSPSQQQHNKRVPYYTSSRIEILTTILLIGVISAIIITVTSPIFWNTCEIRTNKLIFAATKPWNQRIVVVNTRR